MRYDWVWRAWHRLHRDRPLWGGSDMRPPTPGDIGWANIERWAQHHRMTRGEHEMLDKLLVAMDEEYRAWWVRQQNRK